MDVQGSRQSVTSDGLPACGGCPHHRNRHSRPSRQAPLGRLSHACRPGARHHLDPRRTGGDAGRLALGRAEGQPDAALQQCRHRHRQQRLSRRRRARRTVLRLAHRSDRPQEAVLHDARGLSRRHRRDRAVVEFRHLRAVPLCHRRRHRRRIHGDQFDDPGAGAGALSRLDRPRHQRQLLDRRRDRRGRRDRPAQSRNDRSRARLAACLPLRRCPRPRRLPDADLDSGKPALADDPWPAGGRAPDRRRNRAVGDAACASRPQQLADHPTADAHAHAARRGRAHADPHCIAAARCSVWPDDGAGVLLQCDLLHLCADPDRLLRYRPTMSAGTSCRLLRATSSDRCCSAACSTRWGGER